MASDDMDVVLAELAAQYLPAVVDKALNPPPPVNVSQDLREELQLHNAYFLMLYLLRTTLSPYYFKYIRSRKEIAAKGRLLPKILGRRLLTLIPIWERLGYMEKPPTHWRSFNTEVSINMFTMMPTPGMVLWMIFTFASDFAKIPGWQDDILPLDLRNDLQAASKRWTVKYGTRSLFGLSSKWLAESLTEEGLEFAKVVRSHTHGVFGGWHMCALERCEKKENANFKACGR